MKIYKFKIYGHEYETKVVRRDDNEIVFSVNGEEYKAYLDPRKRPFQTKPMPKVSRPIAVPGADTSKTAKPSEPKGAGVVRAPLPGTVLKVVVREGQEVKTGDTLLVMEAMKMQNNISATKAGTVAKILVGEGVAVMEGDELVHISES
ncbi:biotin/lipoyl-binding protein [bacterium]|nr:biotin/lipoyl-binding protein [bacterium]